MRETIIRRRELPDYLKLSPADSRVFAEGLIAAEYRCPGCGVVGDGWRCSERRAHDELQREKPVTTQQKIERLDRAAAGFAVGVALGLVIVLLKEIASWILR